MIGPSEARGDLAAWVADTSQGWFDGDRHLRSLLSLYDQEAMIPELRAFADTCAGSIDRQARETNRDEHLPRLDRYSPIGERVENIVFHPSYHEIGRSVYGAGIMARLKEPGRDLESLILDYLFAQNGEAGHACPIACTAGMIKLLRGQSDVPAAWMERLCDPNYDTHFHASQFLTEIQGGSDVGVNAVTASPAGDGTWRLTGEKWFCSVVDAHLFLVTARVPDGGAGTRGVNAFVVPRRLPDGRLNEFVPRRLKTKLGTRSMASAEIDFHGAVAWRAGDFRQVLDVVLNTSRIHNAMVGAAFTQRAYRDASAFARHRRAFGTPILGFPAVARIVARMKTEAFALRAGTFALASLSDRVDLGEVDSATHDAWRMLLNANKYAVSVRATRAIHDGMEILGGNGAIEDFSVLPRLLRDCLVTEAWEGGHNVLCAQILRDSRRGLHEPMFAFLEGRGVDARLGRLRGRWQQLLALPEAEASLRARDLVDELAVLWQAVCLRAEVAETGFTDAELAAEHLLATSDPSLDPWDDHRLAGRVAALVAA